MVATAGLLADTHNGWDHMNGWGGGWMWLWGVAMMTLFIVFIVFIVWLVRSTAGFGSRGPDRQDHVDSARAILAERYAKGEVSTEEYRERVSELQ